MTTWEIRQGHTLDLLRAMPAESVQTCITSPRNELGQFREGGHWRPKRPYWDAEWCREEYVVKGRSTGEIAAEFGITDAAILFWLRKHSIPRRSISAARELKHWGAVGDANPMYGRTGPANPRYVDGSSPDRQRIYASAAWKSVARQVRARDGHRCTICGSGWRGSRSLHLHHIKPWAGNPTVRLDPANIQTLCADCHRSAHRTGGDAL